MKVVTLNYYKDSGDFWQTSILFAITKPNNIDEHSFTECLKDCLKFYVSIDCLFFNTTNENLNMYAKEFLNNIKMGKNDLWINDSTYLEYENIKAI